MNKANTKVVFSTTVITPALRRALKSNTRPVWHVALAHDSLIETVALHPIMGAYHASQPGLVIQVELFWSPHKRAWFGRDRAYNEYTDTVERECIYPLSVMDAQYFDQLVRAGGANLLALIPYNP